MTNDDDNVDKVKSEKLINHIQLLTAKNGGRRGGYDDAAEEEREEDGDTTIELRWQGAGLGMSMLKATMDDGGCCQQETKQCNN